MGENYIKRFTLVGLLCLFALGVARLDYHLSKPIRVYSIDLNEDGRKDLVVESRKKDRKYVFLQQEDGSYATLQEALERVKSEADSLEAKVKRNLRK
jgi:hypothetical protein